MFSYVGYVFKFDYLKYILGWIIYFVTFCFLYSNVDSMLNIFLSLYYHLSVVPCLILYIFGNTKLWMIMFQIAFLVLIRVLTTVIDRRFGSSIEQSHEPFSFTNSRVVWVLIFAFFVYQLIEFGLPNLSDLNFEDIYEVRENYESSLIDTLLQNIMCKIVLPLIISDAVERKKWAPFFVALIIQFYIYGITGFKTYLLIPALIIATKLIKMKSFKKLIMVGMLGGFAASLIFFYLSNSNMFAAVVFNRLVFLPAQIKEAYFDFFSKNEFVYFSQSSIASILGIESNYATDIVYIIGEKYFNSPDMWTNTGFLADGFANLGVIGGFIVSVILSIELALLNRGIKNPANNFATVVFLLFFIALNDGAIISVSVSGGFLPAVLLIFLTKAGERK